MSLMTSSDPHERGGMRDLLHRQSRGSKPAVGFDRVVHHFSCFVEADVFDLGVLLIDDFALAVGDVSIPVNKNLEVPDCAFVEGLKLSERMHETSYREPAPWLTMPGRRGARTELTARQPCRIGCGRRAGFWHLRSPERDDFVDDRCGRGVSILEKYRFGGVS